MDTNNITKLFDENCTKEELVAEIKRLNGVVDAKNAEIVKIKQSIKDFLRVDNQKDESAKIQKRASDALNQAMAETDAVINKARQAAENIMKRYEASESASKSILPGSDSLFVSKDLLIQEAENDNVEIGTKKSSIDNLLDDFFGERANNAAVNSAPVFEAKPEKPALQTADTAIKVPYNEVKSEASEQSKSLNSILTDLLSKENASGANTTAPNPQQSAINTPSTLAAPAVESEKRDVLSEIFGSGRKEAADNSAEAAKRAEDAVAGARESASVPPASWISDLLKKEKNK